MRHDVRASREATGTRSSAMKSSIQKETWLYRCQADSETLRACQKTLWAAEELCVEHCRRNSVLRAIADQTDTLKVKVTRHCQTLAGESIVVARASRIAWKHASGCVRASACGTAKE